MIARALVLALLVPAFGLAGAGTCAAGAQATAGVVVEFGDRAQEFCVPLDEHAPALDVLTATGLELVVADHGAGQLTLCRVADVGCEAGDCFCACADTERGCTFWGLYTLGARGGWRFAQVGIGELTVGPGDVLGVRWDVQTPDGGAAPRASRPRAVCSRVAPVAAERPASGGPGPGVIAVAAVIAALAMIALRGRARRGEPA